MYSSFFAYNISKPFPFRWFTPVVIVGGCIAIVLVSLLNYVSSSYTLVSTYTNDPNGTVSESMLQGWPHFLAEKLQPNCQPVNILVGTDLLTNNTALTYTLTSVVQNSDDDDQTLSSALMYQNNILTDCSIRSIVMQLDSLTRTSNQIALRLWGVTAQAYITCMLDTERSRATKFNLTAQYNLMPPTVHSLNNVRPPTESSLSNLYMFVGRNKTSKASLYWGESLLSMYWLNLTAAMEDVRVSWQGQRMTSATFTYTVNGTTDDITDSTFFVPSWQLSAWSSDFDPWIGIAMNYEHKAKVNVSGDVLAKAMYSTVLTDLGQTGSPSNILNNASLLQYFTSNFSDILAADDFAGPAKKPYQPGQDGALAVRPAVFNAYYLCQIPQRKSSGAMILTILIADLVFLRSLWSLWKAAVITYMERTDDQTNICQNCRVNRADEDAQQALLKPDDKSSKSRFSSVSGKGASSYELLPMASPDPLRISTGASYLQRSPVPHQPT